MLTISYLVVILIILILHTAITHLINWWFREDATCIDGDVVIPILAHVLEFIAIFVWLRYVVESLMCPKI